MSAKILQTVILFVEAERMEVQLAYYIVLLLSIIDTSTGASLKQQDSDEGTSLKDMSELRDVLTKLEHLMEVQETDDMLQHTTSTPEYSGILLFQLGVAVSSDKSIILLSHSLLQRSSLITSQF